MQDIYESRVLDDAAILEEWDRAEKAERARQAQELQPRRSWMERERQAADVSHPALHAEALTYGLLSPRTSRGSGTSNGPRARRKSHFILRPEIESGSNPVSPRPSQPTPQSLAIKQDLNGHGPLHRRVSVEMNAPPAMERRHRRRSYAPGYLDPEQSAKATAAAKLPPSNNGSWLRSLGRHSMSLHADEKAQTSAGRASPPYPVTPTAASPTRSPQGAFGGAFKAMFARRTDLSVASKYAGLSVNVGADPGMPAHPYQNAAFSPGNMLNKRLSAAYAEGASADAFTSAPGASQDDFPQILRGKQASFNRSHSKNSTVKSLATLAPFVPKLLKHGIAEDDAKYAAFDSGNMRELVTASATLEPSMVAVNVAMMIADVKGFTKLTEILSKKGTAGVELLTNCMNNYFTRVISMINSYDGDVIKFAGDSMIVAFCPTEAEGCAEDSGLRAATMRCTHCAHELAMRLGHMRMKMNGQVEPASKAMLQNLQTDRVPAAVDTHESPGDAGEAATEPMPRRSSVQNRPLDGVRNSIVASRRWSVKSGSLKKLLPTASDGDSPSASQAAAAMHEAGLDFKESDAGGGSSDSLQPHSKHSKGILGNLMRSKGGRSSVTGGTDGTPASASPAHSSGGGGSGVPSPWVPSSAERKASNRQTRTSLPGSPENVQSTLWGEQGGMVQREMSVASKLNLPPSLHVAHGGGSPANSGANSVGTGSMSSFVSGTSGRVGKMPSSDLTTLRNQSNTHNMSWQRQLQTLSNATLTPAAAPTISGSLEFGLIRPERSRLSYSSRAMFSAAMQPHAHTSDTPISSRSGSDDEDEGYHPEVRDLSPGLLKVGRDPSYTNMATGQQHSNMHKKLFARRGSPGPPLSAPDHRGQSVDVQGSVEWSNDSYAVDVLGTSNFASTSGPAAGPSRLSGKVHGSGSHSGSSTGSGPRAIAEGLEPAGSGRASEYESRRGSREQAHMSNGEKADQSVLDMAHASSRGSRTTGGFISRVVSWFGNAGQNQNRNRASSLTMQHPQDGDSSDGGSAVSSCQTHSRAPSGSPMIAPLLLHPPHQRHRESTHFPSKARDPIMEEVQNSTFSLKIMVSAGSACAFHVGGKVDELMDPTLPEVPHWEYFLGDRPLAPHVDEEGRRGCFVQLAAVEDYAEAAEVVASPEAVSLIQDAWEIQQLPDNNGGRILAPLKPYAAHRPSTSLKLLKVPQGSGRHSPRVASQAGSPNHSGGKIQLPADGPKHASGSGVQDNGSTVVLEQHSNSNLVMATECSMVQDSSNEPLMGQHLNSHVVLGTQQSGSHMLLSQDQAHSSEVGVNPALATQLSEVPHGAADLYATGDLGRLSPFSPLKGGSQLTPKQRLMTDSLQQGLRTASACEPQVLGSSPAPLRWAASMHNFGVADADHPEADGGKKEAGEDKALSHVRHEFMHCEAHVQCRMAGMLRMHVLGSVRSHIVDGHLDFINEIRQLTCMFLGFPSLTEVRNDATEAEQLACVQFVVAQVQEVMYKWDGSFLQFRCDEKGYVAICVFGLSGHIHEDNPSRGIESALDLRKRVQDGGHRVCIGVTTGRLLCTCVGARKIRSEFTIFGDAINLSARLMVKCKKGQSTDKGGLADILCDEPTYTKSRQNASYESLEPMALKGKEEPVIVYSVTPYDEATSAAGTSDQPVGAGARVGPARPLVGRNAEMTLILNKASNMISGHGQGGAILVEGGTGMGKTKLLLEVRHTLERINSDAVSTGMLAFNMFFGIADAANRSQKLHPWRRIFKDLFEADRAQSRTKTQGAEAQVQDAESPAEDGPEDKDSCTTLLGRSLATHMPEYSRDWRPYLAELLDMPLGMIPAGDANGSGDAQRPEPAEDEAGRAAAKSRALKSQSSSLSHGRQLTDRVASARAAAAAIAAVAAADAEAAEAIQHPQPRPHIGQQPREGATSLTRSTVGFTLPSSESVEGGGRGGGGSMPRNPALRTSMGGSGSRIGQQQQQPAMAPLPTSHGGNSTAGGGRMVSGPGAAGPPKKNSLSFLVHLLSEFVLLYGPTVLLLENLHDFDTWSWQLLLKVAESLNCDNLLIIATTRPNELPTVGQGHHLHGKAALHQKVAMMYRHLLNLDTTSRINLEPFNYSQTRELMQVISGQSDYTPNDVRAIMEKTGGMPLYIETIIDFFTHKPGPATEINNLSFQQVIIERMDRLKPEVKMCLKVASVMGQSVVLDILHKFYPINRTKEEVRGDLQELERSGFLKPTDAAAGIWEFNMVERDIVYEVIPHYQRRRMHAQLAQELERGITEQHVGILTTIAYHWNQACMSNEVTEKQCALKAIEYWHRAAEVAYDSSSLMEALRLFQKASQIAEILAESWRGESIGDTSHSGSMDGVLPDGPGFGLDGHHHHHEHGEHDDEAERNSGYMAVGRDFKGQLNWSLISRLTRAHWEKSMASCCLGMVLQHKYGEFNSELEFWGIGDYFTLLTEHAIRGLMLLGALAPGEILDDHEERTPGCGASLLQRLLCCGAGVRDEDDDDLNLPVDWEEDLELTEAEVNEARDVLLVLIIAAENYSLHFDGDNFVRLLKYCRRTCTYFQRCSGSELDPLRDIRTACTLRIKNYRAGAGSSVLP